jgi:ketosteroid isomerase-like protein
MTAAPEADRAAALRARRKLTNRLIAAHQAQRLRPFFTEDAAVVVGDGGVILGAAEVIAAFEAQFRDPAFIAYERTTETVEVAADGARAAERGRWQGTWKGGTTMSGAYLAAWRLVHGQWVIERELYVTLA